jgi:hypothetical protein
MGDTNASNEDDESVGSFQLRPHIVHNKEQPILFLTRPLHAVLTARFGTCPAGHWVVFQTTVADVKAFALAHAWSQRGVSYFFSTWGKTTPHETMCMSHYEDDHGNVAHKAINRPEIRHSLYECLPLIDERNKQRQNLLNLKGAGAQKTHGCAF